MTRKSPAAGVGAGWPPAERVARGLDWRWRPDRCVRPSWGARRPRLWLGTLPAQDHAPASYLEDCTASRHSGRRRDLPRRDCEGALESPPTGAGSRAAVLAYEKPTRPHIATTTGVGWPRSGRTFGSIRAWRAGPRAGGLRDRTTSGLRGLSRRGPARPCAADHAPHVVDRRRSAVVVVSTCYARTTRAHVREVGFHWSAALERLLSSQAGSAMLAFGETGRSALTANGGWEIVEQCRTCGGVAGEDRDRDGSSRAGRPLKN